MFAQSLTIYGEISQSYSIPIVLFSILTSCVASFTAVSLNQRIGKDSLISPTLWMIMASITMALGIWAMHFIGMTALDISVPVHHNYPLTFVSLIPALIASFLAFYVANKPRANTKVYFIAGVIMGLGIITMHFIGMSAMSTMGARMNYNPFLVICSVIAAIGISFIALSILSYVSKKDISSSFARIITSILLGTATAAAHYIGMASVSFEKTSSLSIVHNHTQNLTLIIVGISICLAIIFSIMIAASVIDRHVETRVIYLDSITQMPNRRKFMKKLQNKLHVSAVSLIKFPDLLTNFSEINFELEDRYVQWISKNLKAGIPALTSLYRLDDQSFVYVAHDIRAKQDLLQHLKVLQKRFEQPVIIDNHSMKISCIAAIACEDQPEMLDKLFSNAQAAMEHPTTLKKGFSIIQYNPKLHTRNFTTQIVEGLEEAFTKKELFLVYQPKIAPQSNEIVGAEVLIRWQHPTYGLLAPNVFLPILEANHKLFELTDWIIEDVFQMLTYCQNNRIELQKIAINIPGSYLTSPRLKQQLIDMANKYQLSLSYIELEITETSLIREIDKAQEIVTMYRNLGISIALDDFGTGVSSLAYLKNIPITTLKIDKSFIDDIPKFEKDTLIFESMIQLAESLDVDTVIEGVEMKEQLDFILKTCKRPVIQGYYYSKPLPLPAYLTWCDQYTNTLQKVQQVPIN